MNINCQVHLTGGHAIIPGHLFHPHQAQLMFCYQLAEEAFLQYHLHLCRAESDRYNLALHRQAESSGHCLVLQLVQSMGHDLVLRIVYSDAHYPALHVVYSDGHDVALQQCHIYTHQNHASSRLLLVFWIPVKK